MSDSDMLKDILQSLNNFQTEMMKAINDLREDVRENKREIQKNREIEEEHWQENLRRWDQNEKRWKENRWLWAENREKWQQYDRNRKRDRADIIDIFTRYEISIAKSLGDSNAEKMEKLA